MSRQALAGCLPLPNFFDNKRYFLRRDTAFASPGAEKFHMVHFARAQQSSMNSFVSTAFLLDDSGQWQFQSQCQLVVQPMAKFGAAPHLSAGDLGGTDQWIVYVRPESHEPNAPQAQSSLCTFSRMRDKLGWVGVVPDQVGRQMLGLLNPMDTGIAHMVAGKEFRLQFWLPNLMLAAGKLAVPPNLSVSSEGMFGFHTMLRMESYIPQSQDEARAAVVPPARRAHPPPATPSQAPEAQSNAPPAEGVEGESSSAWENELQQFMASTRKGVPPNNTPGL